MSHPLDKTEDDEGPETDGCVVAADGFEELLQQQQQQQQPSAAAEAEAIIKKWSKMAIRITKLQKLYYKFAEAFKAGVVKTRVYCVILREGDDLDAVPKP